MSDQRITRKKSYLSAVDPRLFKVHPSFVVFRDLNPTFYQRDYNHRADGSGARSLETPGPLHINESESVRRVIDDMLQSLTRSERESLLVKPLQQRRKSAASTGNTWKVFKRGKQPMENGKLI